MNYPHLGLTAVPHIPHIQKGQNIAKIILAACRDANIVLEDGDILAVAQKIISKAEGRLFLLNDIVPGERALEVAAEVEKDPRLVELILQESSDISRLRKGVLIVTHRLGFTSANAGIDRSNVDQTRGDVALLLPEDPDYSAAQLRDEILERTGVRVGVVITDSHGRPFRLGVVNIAIGVAGLPALWDRRGDTDLYGYTLKVTQVGVADEIAAAAGLLMGQADEGTPVVLLRGLRFDQPSGTARDLVRPKEMDLYR